MRAILNGSPAAATSGASPATTDGRQAGGPYQYAGATLWASYVKDKFQVWERGTGEAEGHTLWQLVAGGLKESPFPDLLKSEIATAMELVGGGAWG